MALTEELPFGERRSWTIPLAEAVLVPMLDGEEVPEVRRQVPRREDVGGRTRLSVGVAMAVVADAVGVAVPPDGPVVASMPLGRPGAGALLLRPDDVLAIDVPTPAPGEPLVLHVAVS